MQYHDKKRLKLLKKEVWGTARNRFNSTSMVLAHARLPKKNN